MSKSNEYLNHCLDVLEADKYISEATRIIMFTEYARLVVAESNQPLWKSVKERPIKYGRYEVYRAKCEKQHYETWNGIGWASNNNDITHYREIVKPIK